MLFLLIERIDVLRSDNAVTSVHRPNLTAFDGHISFTAFSSEVGTGSRQETAPGQNTSWTIFPAFFRGSV
jgi:hypothetical protein